MEGATGNLGASGRMVVGEAEVLFTPSPRWKSRACLSFPTQRWRGNRSRVRHEQGVKGAGNALCWAGWGQRVVWGWFGCHPQQSPKYTGSPDSSPPTEPGQGPGGAGRATGSPAGQSGFPSWKETHGAWDGGPRCWGGGGCAFGFGVLCMCTRVDACSCWLDQGVHACVCACVHACMCVCMHVLLSSGCMCVAPLLQPTGNSAYIRAHTRVLEEHTCSRCLAVGVCARVSGRACVCTHVCALTGVCLSARVRKRVCLSTCPCKCVCVHKHARARV